MRLALFGAVLLIAGCAQGQALPDDIAILDPKLIPDMLKQCSREVPYADGKGWTPDLTNIRKLEVALPAALKSMAATEAPSLRKAPRGWVRQYVGTMHDGRRFIYGSFLPRDSVDGEKWVHRSRWKSEPWIVCDGGPRYFGVEYDVENGRITHIAFNGIA